ncbi:DUF2357 domain-containing protein [Planctomycetota bacterium]|nr:DUF2357 domain-containing protein [Planctomycetota bacterium]
MEIGNSTDAKVQSESGLRLFIDHDLAKSFRWNGSGPSGVFSYGPSGSGFRNLPVPDSDVQEISSVYSLGNVSEGSLKILGFPLRAGVKERDQDPRELWIFWLNQRFKDITKPKKKDLGLLDSDFGTGVRRSWTAVRDIWKKGGEGQPEYSLIVELSEKVELKSSLKSISNNPRKMLQRLHASTKLSKIREFDSYSLREYARAPGRNLAEKGGAKQELTAVIKEETADLIENQITFWSIDRMYRLALSYCENNKHFENHTRVSEVREFGILCNKVLNALLPYEIRGLSHHLESPTYCLQFESRYRVVWKAYKKLRLQDEEADDSWKWQYALWGDSSRLILASLFAEMPDWSEGSASTPYFRKENMEGEWLMGPYVPGPYKTPQGNCHIIDLKNDLGLRQINHFLLPKEVFDSGCDWILVWPDRRKISLVWSAIDPIVEGKSVLSSSLDSRLKTLSEKTSWKWSGLILLAEPYVSSEESDWIESGNRIVVLKIPEAVYRHWKDLLTGLQLALDQIHGS